MTTKKYAINTFYKIAEEYRHLATVEEEIAKIDRTNLLYKEIKYMIENGEIVIININAKMRLGKSTVAIALGKDIFEMIKECGQRDKKEQFGMKNIARDQQEFSKLMRDPKQGYTVIIIDEENSLEHTGENSTTEEALSNTLSNVHAGRYIHSIHCSPQDNPDRNADLQLTVISIDKETKTNYCLLYYRYFIGGISRNQLIGNVKIYVGDIVENWVKKGHKLFTKKLLQQATEKEIKELEELTKKDFYIEYYTKKHEKMDLLTKEGIFRPRQLDYAFIILRIVERLKGLSRIKGAITDKLIRSFVKIEFRKEKLVLSIIGERNLTEDVSSILNQHITYERIKEKEKQIRAKIESGKGDKELLEYELKEVSNLRIQTGIVLNDLIKELETYKKIAEKYNEHY